MDGFDLGEEAVGECKGVLCLVGCSCWEESSGGVVGLGVESDFEEDESDLDESAFEEGEYAFGEDSDVGEAGGLSKTRECTMG